MANLIHWDMEIILNNKPIWLYDSCLMCVCILYCCITMCLVSNAKIFWSRSFPSIPPQPVQQLWSSDEEPAENCSYFLPRVPLGALITQQRQRHGLQWQQDSSQPGLQGQYKLTSSVLRKILETLSLFVLLYHANTFPMCIMFIKVTWQCLVLVLRLFYLFIEISLEIPVNIK